MRMDEYFDRLYSSTDRYWWQAGDRYSTNPDSHPRSLLTQQTLRLLRGLPPGRALDLGAGEGPDSIRLAMLGYDVDAVDISRVAAQKIAAAAAAVGVDARVHVIVADVQTLTSAAQYDLVICNGVLHYVQDKVSVIGMMQGATRLGGLNVVSLWSDYTPVPDCHNSVPVFCDAEDGIVMRFYSAWAKELIYFERDKMESAHSDLPPHRHSHIKLIARRSG
jgi:2-polyprenyl-3-methyl-5-hydroxy-6-metoxy-1,4-benzoquinol methylase